MVDIGHVTSQNLEDLILSLIIIIIYFEKEKSRAMFGVLGKKSMKSKCLVNSPEPLVSWSGTLVCMGLWVPELEFFVGKMKKRRKKNCLGNNICCPLISF